ncbi:hypothetical protein A7E78_03175 [Syntrophotalea acetylenivorans]|uniref:Tetratricopeptide repeat protein n=1 Tax=Syntrophotalea acetylenivorans TaxID=1842532 RepID=A0A1L3GLX6_9BACT|nr:tetratricopeptide repeat protein [Syntrophotalea acetylenivorans]APG26924.1 hypothetical protein A7E78_03175 [Syntrophotalea acetylenivorans]
MAKFLVLLIGAVLLLAPFNQIMGSDWLGTAIEVMPLIALALWFWKKRHGDESFELPPGSYVLLILVGWGLLQLVPLPAFLVKLLSPHTWQIYQQSVGALVTDPWMRLSLYPKGTLQAIFTLCSGMACYLLTAQLLQDRHRLKQAALWLTGIGGGVAAATIALYFIKQFISEYIEIDNNLAVFLQNDLAFLGLLLLLIGPVALATMLAFRPSSRYGTLQERVNSYWQATVQDHFLIVALSALLVPFGLALLDWRNALFYLLALGLLWALLFIKKRGRREIPYFSLILVLLVSAVSIGLYNGGDNEKSPEKLITKTDHEIARELASQYSLTGSGLGTYEKVYKRQQVQGAGHDFSTTSGPLIIRARTEIGWLSIIVLIGFFTILLWRSWPKWRRRRNKLAIYLFGGSLGGLLFFVLAVAFWELSIPVWFQYYAFALAGLVSASSQSSYQASDKDDFRPATYNRRYSLATMVAGGLVILSLLFHGGGILAKGLANSAKNADAHGGPGSLSELRLLKHAALYDPWEALYRKDLAWGLLQQGQTRRAMSHFLKALRLDPLAGLETYRMGMYMADAGQEDLAIKLMQHGLENDWSNQVLHVDFVSRFLTKGQKTAALKHVRQILAIDPPRTLEWLRFLNDKGLEVTEVAVVLAGHPQCYIDFGDYLLERDLPELAANSYSKALRILQGAESFQPDVVWRMVSFFEARQEYEKALNTVLVGTRLYPEDLAMMEVSGRLHERLGLTFKAAEIYRKILIHTPEDLELRRHLNQLEGQRH